MPNHDLFFEQLELLVDNHLRAVGAAASALRSGIESLPRDVKHRCSPMACLNSDTMAAAEAPFVVEGQGSAVGCEVPPPSRSGTMENVASPPSGAPTGIRPSAEVPGTEQSDEKQALGCEFVSDSLTVNSSPRRPYTLRDVMSRQRSSGSQIQADDVCDRALSLQGTCRSRCSGNTTDHVFAPGFIEPNLGPRLSEHSQSLPDPSPCRSQMAAETPIRRNRSETAFTPRTQSHFSVQHEPLDSKGELLAMWARHSTQTSTTRTPKRTKSLVGRECSLVSPGSDGPEVASGGFGVAAPGEERNWHQWEHFLRPFILKPSTPTRIYWDIAGMLCVFYDIITIPLAVFGPFHSLFLDVMTGATSSYWALDIPVSFITAEIVDGIVPTRPLYIARHYIRSWFLFDVAVVLVDLCISFATALKEEGVPAGSYSRLGQALRFMRFFRLLRLLKVQAFIGEMTQRIQSEHFLIVVGIAKLLLFIVLVNHCLACMWYGLGLVGESALGLDTWIQTNELPMRSVLYKYLTALHWSITQFTPASMEVVPANSLERVFTVCVIFFAMVLFSSFISSITAAMQRLRSLESAKLERQSKLRQYIKQNRLSAELTACVWGHLRVCTTKNHFRLHEKDVVLLGSLPPGCLADVRAQVFGPVLIGHPFFHHFGRDFASDQAKIYKRALTEKAFLPDQEVFSPGEAADRVFFVIGGELEYRVGLDDPVMVKANAWLGEPLLWLFWEYAGTLRSRTRSELFYLDAPKVVQILRLHEETARYARAFGQYYAQNEYLITDLQLEQDVLTGMVAQAFVDPNACWAEFAAVVPPPCSREEREVGDSGEGEVMSDSD